MQILLYKAKFVYQQHCTSQCKVPLPVHNRAGQFSNWPTNGLEFLQSTMSTEDSFHWLTLGVKQFGLCTPIDLPTQQMCFVCFSFCSICLFLCVLLFQKLNSQYADEHAGEKRIHIQVKNGNEGCQKCSLETHTSF